MKNNCSGKKKEFEVTFSGGKGRFADEYGFGDNPPANLSAKNKSCLRKQLKPMIKRDKVKIKKIEEVRW